MSRKSLLSFSVPQALLAGWISAAESAELPLGEWFMVLAEREIRAAQGGGKVKRTRKLSPEERERRMQLAKQLHAEGKFGGRQPKKLRKAA